MDEQVTGTNSAVTVRYWAGARAVAGVESEAYDAADVAALRAAITRRRPEMAEVLPRCSVLVSGTRAGEDATLTPGVEAEILPPFAGG